MKQLSLFKWRTSKLLQVIELTYEATLVDINGLKRVTNSAAIHMHSVHSAAEDTAWYSGLQSALKLNFLYTLAVYKTMIFHWLSDMCDSKPSSLQDILWPEKRQQNGMFNVHRKFCFTCAVLYCDHHVRNALLNEMQVFGECNITVSEQYISLGWTWVCIAHVSGGRSTNNDNS